MATPTREIFRVNPVDIDENAAIGIDLPLVKPNGAPFGFTSGRSIPIAAFSSMSTGLTLNISLVGVAISNIYFFSFIFLTSSE